MLVLQFDIRSGSNLEVWNFVRQTVGNSGTLAVQQYVVMELCLAVWSADSLIGFKTSQIII